jgi:hypothetical protein
MIGEGDCGAIAGVKIGRGNRSPTSNKKKALPQEPHEASSLLTEEERNWALFFKRKYTITISLFLQENDCRKA